jgi:hypothetical protein
MRLFALLMVAGLCAVMLSARAGNAPTAIKLGTLYVSSVRFASISMPVHYDLTGCPETLCSITKPSEHRRGSTTKPLS